MPRGAGEHTSGDELQRPIPLGEAPCGGRYVDGRDPNGSGMENVGRRVPGAGDEEI